MHHEYDVPGMAEKIRLLKQTATELKDMSDGIPAVERNVERMLSSIRLLELDITDVIGIL